MLYYEPIFEQQFYTPAQKSLISRNFRVFRGKNIPPSPLHLFHDLMDMNPRQYRIFDTFTFPDIIVTTLLTTIGVYDIIKSEKGGGFMEKIINYNNLRNFCYSNDLCIKGDIKGIVLEFMGLGGMKIHNSDPGDALELAEKGIIYVIPYYNPWCWMNKQSVKFVDEIIAVLCERYDLNGETVKIVSTGGSMGGLCALVYCAYAKITPCLCVTNCPVCDLVYHFTERPDLPRTLYSAFGEYEGTMENALKSCSPFHLVEKMPNIPYTIFHCEEDKSVNLEKHSLRFVEEMQKAHSIVLKTVPLRGHCDLSAETRVEYKNCIINGI